MEVTRKLYDQDGYAIEFEAVVLSCEKEEKDGKVSYQVILDQSLFFPEEGGQSPDQGTINGIEVLDVQIKKDVITHTLSEAVENGNTVRGKIDWKHRFNNMQQHSGEHIFSGIVHKKYGFENVGFHLSNQIVTMDFDGALGEKQIAEIEYEVNAAIVKNIPIEVTFPTKDELTKMEYRSKIEIDGQVRIVTIPGYDVCACCAPHVKRTGEIGLLKVMNIQSYKGGVRISILCGFRALEAFCQKSAVLSDLSVLLSANQEGLAGAVTKLKENNQTLKSKIATMNQEQMKTKLAAVEDDVSDVLLFEEGLDQNAMRNAVNELVAKHCGVCGIFSGNEDDGYQFIIGSSSVDCRELAARLREVCQARGGGSAAMIQGSVTAKKKVIIEALK